MFNILYRNIFPTIGRYHDNERLLFKIKMADNFENNSQDGNATNYGDDESALNNTLDTITKDLIMKSENLLDDVKSMTRYVETNKRSDKIKE